MEAHKAFFLFVAFFYVGEVDSYYVSLHDNGPVVLGANITFVAKLYNSAGEPPSGTFRFRWQDNALPEHSATFEGPETVSVWNVSYPSRRYSPGAYEVEVNVDKSTFFIWPIPITSNRKLFNLTSMLNGDMVSTQGNTTLNSGFVSNAKSVLHSIHLRKPDREFLTEKATSVVSYWFVDCVYYGQSPGYQFLMNYTEPGKVHDIKGLIVASFEPIVTTTVAPPTTTTATTTTTIGPTNITTTTTTTKPTVTTPSVTTTTDATFQRSNVSRDFPFECLNSSLMLPDMNKTYGYFHQRITVKAPISNVKVDGTNWLQRDDLLNLLVSWDGSPNYEYCLRYISGAYDLTGKETCNNGNIITRNNSFKIMHYFRTRGVYTILLFISNGVSAKVSPVTITIYEVTKQAQLSVIVVPVACCSLAVILVVFGVAYYIQSRSRYTVEVADFNFAQSDSMEYKTFRERLKEAVQGSGYRCPDFGKSDGGSWSPTGGGNHYGRLST